MVQKRSPPKNCFWRGDTLWARFEVCGREIRRSLRTDDAKVAEGRLKSLRERETASARFGDARTTYEDALLSWGSDIVSRVRQSTVSRYAQSLDQIKPYMTGMFIDEVDKRVVNDVVSRRRALGVKNATIRRDLVALSSVLTHCQDEGWIEGNAALDKMRRLKEKRDPIVLPRPDDIEAVIKRAPGNFGAMIRAAWLTGCRQDELRRMERSHLDFKRGQVSIYQTKNGRPRVIEMRGARACLERVPAALHSKVVFWHGDGKPYLNISSNFRRLVRSAQKSARDARREFRPFRFHDLRHLFAVEYLKSGGSIHDLQHHLGHGSVGTTEIYTRYLTAEEDRTSRMGSAQKPDHEHGSVVKEDALTPS